VRAKLVLADFDRTLREAEAPLKRPKTPVKLRTALNEAEIKRMSEPRKISLTPADVLMGGGADMSSLYGRAAAACDFPCEPPAFRDSQTEAPAQKPNFPRVTAPSETVVRLVASDGREVDDEDERQDSKRPPAKRDAEAVLRRYLPAVALQIAHHIARNDL
jgi:hypothetical protein